MSEAVEFLHALVRALAVVALYAPGHARREGALEDAYQRLLDLLEVDKRPIFSFLGDEVVLGKQPLREMRDWEWSGRLAGIGMQRLEFDASVPISLDELEILNKPGRFTPQEREIMDAHPVEGARMILTSDQQLDLAAAVAYEHHIMIDGGGYPSLRYPRDCHFASKLVHVCDVYDALRTKRPYRDPWPAKKVLAYIEEKSGFEFDGALANAFMAMMGEWEPRLSTLHDDGPAPPAQHPPAPAHPAPQLD